MTAELEYFSPHKLMPWAKNARTHSKKQLRQIADSIQQFGFTNPVIIDDGNTILAGHGRVAAAKDLGLNQVPCLRQSEMTDAEKRAYVIADNKLALNAGWDEELLAQELGALYELDLDFDVEITGFSISEIDNLIDGTSVEEPDDPKDELLPKAAPQRCDLGSLWQLGPHRLVCGNSLDPKIIATLMDGKKATMVFTDPPYNVRIDGHVGNSGKTKHREFAMASGEMSADQFTAFLTTTCQNLSDFSTDGSIHCQRRSKNAPVGRSKSTPLAVKQHPVLRVVPVVHRRAPRCFV